MVEGLGLLQVPHVQMDMADRRPFRCSRPRLVTTCRYHAFDVQRIRRHRQLASVPLPGVAWAIGVHLDPESVGIPEVQSLADEGARSPSTWP